MIGLLRGVAAADPDRDLLVASGRRLTYADAVRLAEAQARGLLERGITRFAVFAGDAFDIVPLLAAGSIIGAEPCVYPYLLDDGGVAEYAARFEHTVVVTGRELTLPDGIGQLPFDALATESGRLPEQLVPMPLMILTTGTTGFPKGARHDWSRLIAAARGGDGADARWLLAYNLNQFAGYQVVLQAVKSGATLAVPATNQPRGAVESMRELGVTHASATPTFWRIGAAVLDEATAAQIPLRQITLGGEAVPGDLLERLRQLFPGARISQIYASTEFGSTVSVRDGVHGLPTSVLDRGEDADVAFRIVDGELQVRSRVGMLGYHGQDDVEGWRPTGDLVEVRGDRIEFVGRTSEIINVGGVKVHPLPIEDVIATVPGVSVVRVYGRKNAVTGQIVAADVVAVAGSDEEALEDAIRDACDGLPPAHQPRRIRFVDEITMRDNKVVRSEAS